MIPGKAHIRVNVAKVGMGRATKTSTVIQDVSSSLNVKSVEPTVIPMRLVLILMDPVFTDVSAMLVGMAMVSPAKTTMNVSGLSAYRSVIVLLLFIVVNTLVLRYHQYV